MKSYCSISLAIAFILSLFATSAFAGNWLTSPKEQYKLVNCTGKPIWVNGSGNCSSHPAFKLKAKRYDYITCQHDAGLFRSAGNDNIVFHGKKINCVATNFGGNSVPTTRGNCRVLPRDYGHYTIVVGNNCPSRM